MKLLSESKKINLSNSFSKEYLSVITYWQPNNRSGKNVCSHATKGCIKSCLADSGFLQMRSIQDLMLQRTKLFFNDRKAYAKQLHSELLAALKKANKAGKQLVYRPNGTSDMPWERIKLPAPFNSTLVEWCVKQNIMLYDYTKNPTRLKRVNPSAYHLTLSYSGENEKECLIALSNGRNVSMVWPTDKDKPKRWKEYPVVDGNKHDLTFLHPAGTVIALHAIGKAKHDSSGFVVND